MVFSFWVCVCARVYSTWRKAEQKRRGRGKRKSWVVHTYLGLCEEEVFESPERKVVSYLSLCFKEGGWGWKQSSNGICSRGALEPNQQPSDPNGPQESFCGEGSLMPITANTHIHTHTSISCSGNKSTKIGHWLQPWRDGKNTPRLKITALQQQKTQDLWLWDKSHRGQSTSCHGLFIYFTAR